MKTPSAKAMAVAQAIFKAEELLTQLSQKRRFVKRVANCLRGEGMEFIAGIEDYMLQRHPKAKRLYAACLAD